MSYFRKSALPLTIAASIIGTAGIVSCSKEVDTSEQITAVDSAAWAVQYNNGFSTEVIPSSISSMINNMTVADQKSFWTVMHVIAESCYDMANTSGSTFYDDLKSAAGVNHIITVEDFFDMYPTYETNVDAALSLQLGTSISSFVQTTFEFNGGTQVPCFVVPDRGQYIDGGSYAASLGFEGQENDTDGDFYPSILEDNGSPSEVLLAYDGVYRTGGTGQDDLDLSGVIGLMPYDADFLSNVYDVLPAGDGIIPVEESDFESGSGSISVGWPVECLEVGSDLANPQMKIKDRNEFWTAHSEIELSYHTWDIDGANATFSIEDLAVTRVAEVYKTNINTMLGRQFSMGDIAPSLYNGVNGYSVYGCFYEYDWMAATFMFSVDHDGTTGYYIVESANPEYMRWKVDAFEWCYNDYLEFSNDDIYFKMQAE